MQSTGVPVIAAGACRLNLRWVGATLPIGQISKRHACPLPTSVIVTAGRNAPARRPSQNWLLANARTAPAAQFRAAFGIIVARITGWPGTKECGLAFRCRHGLARDSLAMALKSLDCPSGRLG